MVAPSCSRVVEPRRSAPDTIQNHGCAKPFLLYGVCIRHPAEGAAQNFADAIKLIFWSRKGFEKIDRMAAVGVVDVIVEGGVCFHPRDTRTENRRPVPESGATLPMSCHHGSEKINQVADVGVASGCRFREGMSFSSLPSWPEKHGLLSDLGKNERPYSMRTIAKLSYPERGLGLELTLEGVTERS